MTSSGHGQHSPTHARISSEHLAEGASRIKRLSLNRISLSGKDKDNVVKQATLMETLGTPWHAVKTGNLEMIIKLFPGSDVYAKGPVGENVFHIAMLLNTPSSLAIAKYLIQHYGTTLVNTPFQERQNDHDAPGLYEGQTALHIAIVHHDFDMVKHLVTNGADVRARAYGPFFKPGGAVYHGEFPLSFAACTGQKEVVAYLIRHGARINLDRDTSGSTALHMTVYSEQFEMYDFLVERGASEGVRDNMSKTPMVLAAALGKVEMFQHIYNKRRRVAWAYGPITCYSLVLREIDSTQSRNEAYVPSALETVIRKGHHNMLDDQLLQMLLANKWWRFAAFQFVLQTVLYLVFVLSQTFLIWLYCSPEEYNSWHFCALEYVGLIFAAIFLGIELMDFGCWVHGLYCRNSATRVSAPYNPPLYHIPGQTLPVPDRSRLSLFNRFTHAMLPLAEGRESSNRSHSPHPSPTPQPSTNRTRSPGVVSFGSIRSSTPHVWDPEALEHGGLRLSVASPCEAVPLAPPGTLAGQQHPPAAPPCQRPSARPVAEAADDDSNDSSACNGASGGGGVQLPLPPPLLPPGAELEPTALGLRHRAIAPIGAQPVSAAGPSFLGPPSPPHEVSGRANNRASHSGGGAGSIGSGVFYQRSCSRSETALDTTSAGLERSVHMSSYMNQLAQHAAALPLQLLATAGGTPAPVPGLATSSSSGGHHPPKQPYTSSSDIVSVGLNTPRNSVLMGSALPTRPSFSSTPSVGRNLNMLQLALQSEPGTQYRGSVEGAGLHVHGMNLHQHAPYSTQCSSDLQQQPHHQPQLAYPGAHTGPDVFGPLHAASMSLGGGPTHLGGTMGRQQSVPLASAASGRPDELHIGEIGMPPASPRAPEVFRNRPRGAGGDLPSAIHWRRPESTRDGSSVGGVAAGGDGGGGGGGSAGNADPGAQEDYPHPALTLVGHGHTLLHASREYMWRKLKDPTLLIMHAHAQITFIHFVTWASSYGFEGGSGPSNVHVMQFNDLLVSMMGLTGWLGALYYARGWKATGKAVAVLERCALDVGKYLILYFLCNIGFTLAFYTLAKGTTYVMGRGTLDEFSDTRDRFPVDRPFSSIGYGMVQLVRFMYGEADWDTFALVPFGSKEAFATIFFLLYVALVILLLMNLLTAMIVHTCGQMQEEAARVWQKRWAAYVMRAEMRMPASLQQRWRSGKPSFDPLLKTKVWTTSMEVYEAKEDKQMEREAQIRHLEGLLDELRARGGCNRR